MRLAMMPHNRWRAVRHVRRSICGCSDILMRRRGAMKHGILRWLFLDVLAAALAVCLGGCVFESVDQLYALPVLPQEYKDLQTTIENTMNEIGRAHV